MKAIVEGTFSALEKPLIIFAKLDHLSVADPPFWVFNGDGLFAALEFVVFFEVVVFLKVIILEVVVFLKLVVVKVVLVCVFIVPEEVVFVLVGVNRDRSKAFQVLACALNLIVDIQIEVAQYVGIVEMLCENWRDSNRDLVLDSLLF